MGKKTLTDEALFTLIRKFMEENVPITEKDCDDEVARLIGKDSSDTSSD